MAMRGKGSTASTARPSGMGSVGEKRLLLRGLRAPVPKEEPSFSENKDVKAIVRAVTEDEPWIRGRIWGVHKRWKMSTDGRCTWSLRDECLSDDRYSGSLGFSW